MGKPAPVGLVNAPHGEGRVLPGSSKMESLEPGMVINGAEKEVVDIGTNDEHLSEPRVGIGSTFLIQF